VLKPGGDLREVKLVDLEQITDLKFPTDCEVTHELRREAQP
jgi:hypothetical protein